VIHEINKARSSGFMPYTLKEAVFLDDPVLTKAYQLTPAVTEQQPDVIAQDDECADNTDSFKESDQSVAN